MLIDRLLGALCILTMATIWVNALASAPGVN
jgi:hypothetical protein